jgi:hypothetical protein
MKYQKERCLQCDRLTRPKDLDSKYKGDLIYGELDATGQFCETDYWFCSDKCYEEAFSKYLPAEYMPKYWLERSGVFAPGLSKAIDDLDKRYHEKYGNITGDVLQRIKPQYAVDFRGLLSEWRWERDRAVQEARLELKERVESEFWLRFNKDVEDFLEEDNRRSETVEKTLAAIEAKQQLEQERIDKMKPRAIPEDAYYEHVHVLGGSGVGKSSLIIRRFIDLWNREDNPNIIIIDPKGPLVDRLSRDEIFSPWHYGYQRHWDSSEPDIPLILIDPTKFAPALNMFAKPKRSYTGVRAEQVENNTIALFQYMFSSKDAKLTDKQLTCFSYCVKLLFTIPDATIQTLFDLFKDPTASRAGGIRATSPFKPYIERLDPISQRFFFDYFYDATEYGATKDQIATRIHGMLRYATFQKMFLAKENKLDMFEFLQSPRGMVMLVASPEAMLGAEGSQLFCRYIVALAIQGAYERINIPESQWRPAYILMDEAHVMVDEVNTGSLLTQMRHFKLGALLAHQNIKQQLSEGIFSTISANTRIKIAATRSSADAYAMAKDMRCEPEFIMDQKKVGTKLHFAVFCDGVTPHPFSYELDARINNFQLMEDEWYEILIDQQRQRYGATEEPPKKELNVNVPETQASIEDAPDPNPPNAQATPAVSDPTADPHTGDHTKPASKWGDS